MPTGRNHVASAVVDDCMYVLGGRPPLNLDVVEHYDPATNSWKAVAPMPVARSGFAAVVVGRRVVVFGGEAGGGTIAPVDAYDADADTWAGLPRCARRATASAGRPGDIASSRSRAGPSLASPSRASPSTSTCPESRRRDYLTTIVPCIWSGCRVQT